MDDFERDNMLAFAYQLRERELEPFTWEDPFSDMGTDEKSKLLVEFVNQNHSLKEIVELMKAERASSLDYKAKFEEEHKLREVEHKLNISLQSRLDKLLQTIDSLRERLDLMNQHRYGSKKRKRKSTQSKTACTNHTKDKDDFDGTAGSVGMDSPCASSAEDSNGQPHETAEKEFRYYRQGMEYRTMKADKAVCHRSDLNRLPEGATVIKLLHRYSYEQVNSIVEHDYELIRYKMLDGSILGGYFPCAGAPEVIDVVPGTHASGSFLAYLAFN